ncbi:MAG TPA: hypothetical protein VEH04_10990 [Verrucomicrobiae bacterium]|nr:hypothetical protein [Verrucomicrobiae bacterium]
MNATPRTGPLTAHDRVRRHTRDDVQRRIDRHLESSIRYHATQSREVISARIEALSREWDIERVLETNASTLALTGALLGLAGYRKALLLTCGVLGFLLQHAISGWCPPLPILRQLGLRTQSEIDREIFALRFLRGDFDNVPAQRDQGEPHRSQELIQSLSA